MADLVYRTNEVPRSKRDWLLYTAQWLVTMFYAVVWGYAIVGVGLGFKDIQLTNYLSAIVLTIGLGTLLQAAYGHRMAMVSGPNVIPSLAIIAAYGAGGAEYALQAFNAQAIAGVIVFLLVLAGIVRRIRMLWTPLVLGSMIIMVGLSVAGLGVASMASAGFGIPFFISLGLAVGGSALAIRASGLLATLPTLLIIGLGYILFFAFGFINLNFIASTPWFIMPRPFPFGIAMPPWDLILVMVIVTLMAALNFYGNLHGYAAIVEETIHEKDERRAFSIFTLVETVIPGVLGTPATVAYGENLGIVQLTRVAARRFIVAAAAIFTALAFVGPFVALMAAMPGEIAGAVLLGIASTVLGIGANALSTAASFGRREQTLVGFSIFLSLGLYLLPAEAWAHTPNIIKTVLSNPIISVIIFVMLFEHVIFREKTQNRSAK